MATWAQDRLKGSEKAAVLLLTLGTELSAEVLKHLEDRDVEALTREVIRFQKVSDDVKINVMVECYQAAMAGNHIIVGGTDYAHRMLSKAFGFQKADGMISKVSINSKRPPFEFLRDSDPAQLVNFVQAEQPQTIALILSHLKPNQAASILSSCCCSMILSSFNCSEKMSLHEGVSDIEQEGTAAGYGAK